MTEHTTRSLTLLAALWLAMTALPAPSSAATTSPEIDALVASLDGAWLGSDNDTPFGKMDFVTLFAWETDGSLHSRSSLNRDTYIDLRFRKDESGRWMLTEEAGMEGLGVQSHLLEPTGRVGDTGLYRWVDTDRPDFLAIDIGVADETLVLTTTLRGEPHVAFRLDHQPEAAWPAIREQLAAQAQLPPAEGTSIRDVLENVPAMAAPPASDPLEDPIPAARSAVAVAPASGAARLALAKALGAAIDADPSAGPRYAFEMRESLTTAIELDPELVEAYHWLVGYYLSAPPIAGGSASKATEVARRLAEIDPAGAQALLERIAGPSAN